MMHPCHCGEWAQWRVRKPHFDTEGKITGWELISMLCGKHKQEQQAMEDNKTLMFDFVGAVPCLS